MKLFRPLPPALTRPLSVVLLLAWGAQMGLLVHRSYLQAAPLNLATDLARYGRAAQWRGIYYRGEKIGFTVSQTVPTEDGYELQEDGELQVALLGATSSAHIRTTARVDQAFALRSFLFSLDPGTGPITVQGTVHGQRLALALTTAGGTRTEERDLGADPALSLNVARRLAGRGLVAGARHEFAVFDPATLQNAPMVVEVGKREVVRVEDRPVPAFRVEMQFSGLRTTSWITDTGESVREESPMGLILVRETRERAVARSVSRRMQLDLMEAAAVVPEGTQARIDQPRDVLRLRLRLTGADLSSPDLRGVGQSVEGDVVEIRDPRTLRPGPADPEAARSLAPEPLIESDAPEIKAEALKAVGALRTPPERAEKLVRHVNALLEKKPTVSLPSAREVLRTRVGDCNEHTALYVALARSLGIPARVAVGLVHVHGAFYYHAWPEVYLDSGGGRGHWLPVDPTLNEYPADGTHLRLARGGLDKQTAILPLVGRLKMTVLDLELTPGSTPVLVGPAKPSAALLDFPLPSRQEGSSCWSQPGRSPVP